MFKKVLKAKNPVLLWSGGLDSTLLLAMLMEQGIKVDILQLGRNDWTKGQKQRTDTLIKELGLKVFSYAPSKVSFIGDGQDISAVFEYAVGGSTVPLVRDLIAGTKCIADLEGQRLHRSPINWDLYIVGSRKDDKHYATSVTKPEWTVGDAKFIAPLFNMTRDEVKAELRARGLDDSEASEENDEGNIQLCDLCLRAVETIECPLGGTIEPQGTNLPLNLVEFRKRYDTETLQES